MKSTRTVFVSTAVSVVLASTLCVGMVGCSKPAATNTVQNTPATQTTTTTGTATDGKYQTANGTVGITEAVSSVDVEWTGGSVIISTVPASAFSIMESAKGQLPDDAKMRYYVEGGTLHVRVCASSYNSAADGKTLIVNVPGGTPLNSVTVNGNTTAVRIAIPSLTQAIVKTTGQIDFSTGDALTKCDLQAGNGAVNLELDPSLNFTLKTEAGSGALNSVVGEVKDPNTVINGNGSAQITVKTAGGPVTINAAV